MQHNLTTAQIFCKEGELIHSRMSGLSYVVEVKKHYGAVHVTFRPVSRYWIIQVFQVMGLRVKTLKLFSKAAQ